MTNELATTQSNNTNVRGALVGFDVNAFAGKKRIFNAMNSAGSLNDYLSEKGLDTLKVEGIIIQVREDLDEVSGELTPVKGAVFITEDGAFYSQSCGIVRSAENLIGACGGEFPVGEELELHFYEIKLDNKRNLKEFELV